MLWPMFCWKTSGLAIHVDVTLTHITYLGNVADHVHSFMEMVFPNGSGIFQQDKASYHKVHIFQEWFEEQINQFQVLTWLPYFPDLNSIEHMWDVLDEQV